MKNVIINSYKRFRCRIGLHCRYSELEHVGFYGSQWIAKCPWCGYEGEFYIK